MKIVYISSSSIPSRAANSIHVMKMCQALARNGHEVTLLAPDTRGEYEEGVEDLFSFYGVEPSFEIIKLRVPNVKGRGYLYGLAAARRARAFAPDTVYCRNVAGCYFSLLAGMKAVLEIHSPVEEGGWLQGAMFAAILKSRHLVKLVAITEALKAHVLESHKAFGGAIQVSPDGADEVVSNIEPVSLPGDDSRLRVGYVGHLYKGKGMEVVAPLASLCPWASFHIIGGEESDIERWKARCAYSGNIIFHGYRPPGDIPRYILAFDVLLLPNQERVSPSKKGDIGRWTSPLKLFEYFSAGRAVVASDLPVLREILAHDVNALLCPPTDVEAWALALQRLRDDRNLCNRLGKTAKSEFLSRYTWSKRAEALLGHAAENGVSWAQLHG